MVIKGTAVARGDDLEEGRGAAVKAKERRGRRKRVLTSHPTDSSNSDGAPPCEQPDRTICTPAPYAHGRDSRKKQH